MYSRTHHTEWKRRRIVVECANEKAHDFHLRLFLTQESLDGNKNTNSN